MDESYATEVTNMDGESDMRMAMNVAAHAIELFKTDKGVRPIEMIFEAVEALKEKDRINVMRRGEIKDHLRELTRESESLKTAFIRPSTVLSHTEYEDKLKDLTVERTEYQKRLTEASHQTSLASRELDNLKKECEDVELPNKDKEVDVGGDALRLKLFWDLGFVPVLDENSNRFDKMLINREDGDIRVTNLNQEPSFASVNQLWNNLV